jgi:hypothetical protein
MPPCYIHIVNQVRNYRTVLLKIVKLDKSTSLLHLCQECKQIQLSLRSKSYCVQYISSKHILIKQFLEYEHRACSCYLLSG